MTASPISAPPSGTTSNQTINADQEVVRVVDSIGLFELVRKSNMKQLHEALLLGLTSDGWDASVLAILQDPWRANKIRCFAEELRREVQVRNGPLITVMYALLGSGVAALIVFLVNINNVGIAPALLSFAIVLVVAALALVVSFLVTQDRSKLLTMLDSVLLANAASASARSTTTKTS